MVRILVDTSVWIEYFRSGAGATLSVLIEEDLVTTNDLILTELTPFAEHLNQFELVDALQALEKEPLQIQWEGLRQLQLLNLRNGINRVGIPDLIIVQQVIDRGLHLWSYDNHFKQMSQIVNLHLFKESNS